MLDQGHQKCSFIEWTREISWQRSLTVKFGPCSDGGIHGETVQTVGDVDRRHRGMVRDLLSNVERFRSVRMLPGAPERLAQDGVVGLLQPLRLLVEPAQVVADHVFHPQERVVLSHDSEMYRTSV